MGAAHTSFESAVEYLNRIRPVGIHPFSVCGDQKEKTLGKSKRTLLKVSVSGPRCSGRTEFLRWLEAACFTTCGVAEVDRYAPIHNPLVSDPELSKEIGLDLFHEQYGTIDDHSMYVLVGWDS